MNYTKQLAIAVLIIGTFGLSPQNGIAQSRGEDNLDLPALLALYRDWGLPLPPADAKLVARHSGSARIDGEVREIFDLGFRVPGKNDEPGSILVGTEWRSEDANWNAVDASEIEPEKVHANQRRIFPYNSAPATAIQLEARGAHAMAVALFKAGSHTYPQLAYGNPGDREAVTSQPGNLSPKTVLAYVAWAHWAIALHEPKSDRAAIARRLEELAAAEPALSKDEGKSALLRSLNLTTRPSQSAPESIDAMIDDLANVEGNAGVNRFALNELRNDPRYLKLAMRGFEAVPALIQHLTDRRITRVVRTGPNMTIPMQLCVGDLASRIISGLAGNGLSPSWLADRERLTPEHRATAADWWASAKRGSEEDYMVAHVFPPKQGRYDHLDELMFRIIAARYPSHLQSLFSKLVEIPDVRVPPHNGLPDASGELLVNILAESSLPLDEKIALLLQTAEQGNGWLADGASAMLTQFPHEEVAKVNAARKKKS